MPDAKWRPFCFGFNGFRLQTWFVIQGLQKIEIPWSNLQQHVHSYICIRPAVDVLSGADHRRIRHINTETGWPQFCRRHFQKQFLEWKTSYFGSNFTEIFPQKGFDHEQASVGSDDYSATNRPNAMRSLYWDGPLVGRFVGSYRKTSCISRTKSQNLNVSHLLLQWSLPNALKPCVKLKMKM